MSLSRQFQSAHSAGSASVSTAMFALLVLPVAFCLSLWSCTRCCCLWKSPVMWGEFCRIASSLITTCCANPCKTRCTRDKLLTNTSTIKMIFTTMQLHVVLVNKQKCFLYFKCILSCKCCHNSKTIYHNSKEIRCIFLYR